MTKLPASWYIAVPATRVTKQKPVKLDLFGKALVAWRDARGQPTVMERYCSHMGANLALGKLKEDCLECPFHGWQFDRTGQCSYAPDIVKPPKTAFQPTYPVVEKYGYLWVWHGSVVPLYPVPYFLAFEEARKQHMSLRFAFKVKTTPRRVLENAYDNYHFIRVHGLQATTAPLTLRNQASFKSRQLADLPLEARFGGTMEAQVERFVGPAGVVARALGLSVENFRLETESWPGGHIITLFLDNEAKFTALVTVTPVAEHYTIQQNLLLVKKTGKFGPDLAQYTAFGLQTILSGLQDVPIWNNMLAEGGGAYSKNDRGVLEFRKFYQKWIERSEQEQAYAKPELFQRS